MLLQSGNEPVDRVTGVSGQKPRCREEAGAKRSWLDGKFIMLQSETMLKGSMDSRLRELWFTAPSLSMPFLIIENTVSLIFFSSTLHSVFPS